MTVRLLAYDLDGTVLNDHNEVTEASLTALRKVVDQGIAVASISGRNVEKSQEPFAGVTDIQRATYLGCYNGAMVLGTANGSDDGPRRILHEQRLPGDVCLDVGAYVAERGINVVFCSCTVDESGVQETYIADRDSESVRALAVLAGLDMAIDQEVVDRIRSGKAGLPPKLLVLPGVETRDDVLVEMREMLGRRAYLARTVGGRGDR